MARGIGSRGVTFSLRRSLPLAVLIDEGLSWGFHPQPPGAGTAQTPVPPSPPARALATLASPCMRTAEQGEAQGSARAFVCARCGAEVLVCRRCDRGQHYCGRACALAARRESLREAGRRYQRSRAGRFAHARRARRYRQRRRQQEIVTHHGSQAPGAPATVEADPRAAQAAAAGDGAAPATWHCHWCERECAPLLRRGFLRHGQVWVASTVAPRSVHGRPP